jgi:ABC-type amino acid transport substrate-binding protein
MFAEKLQKKLDYVYFPESTAFVRMTLGTHRCDFIMGFPQGDELVQGTNPYYRTAYALIAKQGSGLEEVKTLEDQRLKGKHIGIVAGTPPAIARIGGEAELGRRRNSQQSANDDAPIHVSPPAGPRRVSPRDGS